MYVDNLYEPKREVKFLNGYEVIDETELLPNINIGYVPIEETQMKEVSIS